MRGAKSFSGLRGNLRFIVNHKVWASVVLVLSGAAVGGVIGWLV